MGEGGLEWDECAISAALAGETKGHCFKSTPMSVTVLVFFSPVGL